MIPRLLLLFSALSAYSAGPLNAADLFDPPNLAAWCIVPFDAKKRSPEERAEMVAKMGIRKIAYDWRQEHVPEFEREILAYQKHGIEFFAFWSTHEDAFRLFEKHGLHPQIWMTLREGEGSTPEEKVKGAAAKMLPAVERTRQAGCKLGLYNHGGWGGEPENMIAVCEYLRQHHAADHVGIVYNLHHGHSHLDRLSQALAAMKPYLICLNLNGMDINGDAKGRKILPLGAGTEDVKVLRQIRASGYSGPIGILNHTNEDAEGRLLDNLDGLRWLLPQLDDNPPGAKPRYRTWSSTDAPKTQNPKSEVRKVPGISESNTDSKAPAPAPFTPDLKPLNPGDNQHWREFVNRERVFDYYGKQARHFMKQKPLPELIPAFPGLDGGQQGHWGNQNDQVTWKDGRWAASDLGNVFSTVFKGAGVTVPKGVCVRFDDKAAVFDPETLSFPVVWSGGFIKLNDKRHGFMGGGQMDGTVLAKNEMKRPAADFEYHGFYRHGKEVIFSYLLDGKKHLVTARQDGQDRSSLTNGSPAQWPQWIETQGKLGTQTPFATDTLTIPFDNPHGTLFFITAHDFFSNGASAAVSTMTGEIWLVKGIDGKLDRVRWKRFATGLHQPLGLKIVQDKIHVLGRDQITRLHDLNGDDEADFYECVTNAMQTSPGGHDFIVGLETDAQGRWYFASGNQGVCRTGILPVSSGAGILPAPSEPGILPGSNDAGRMPVPHPTGILPVLLATGFRNPNGLGLSPDDRFITTSVQEGDWTPASAICQIEAGQNEGAHFGAGGPKNGQPPEPPLLYLPRGEDNSSSSQAFIIGDAWAGLKGNGNLIHLSSGGGSAWLVMRQNVAGRWQGAAVKLSGNFDSGPQCARFNPRDCHLYVTGMAGWGSYTPKDGCFQRVRFTGGPAPVPIAFEARDNGVLLRFNQPLDAGVCADPSRHFAQCWNYQYSAAYGSPEYSVRYPGTPGHDPLEIRSAQVLDEDRALFLEIPQLVPAGQIHLHVSVTEERAHDIFLTAHALAEPFTDFPGYTKIAKTLHAAQTGLGAPAPSKPNPWAEGDGGREIVVEAALGLQFVQKQLTARAGEKLTLVFKNPDVVPHNWLLAKPGSLQKLGDLCNLMIADPQGLARHYVPGSEDVLVYTDMVNPQKTFTIHFTAPEQSGDYPYLCTFPGHWMIMNGVFTVSEN